MDNFVGGLIFGALFSLVVNLVTFQLQEHIQRQRIFEALENEIVNHVIHTNNLLKEDNRIIDAREYPNMYFSRRRFSENVWHNPEVMKYLVQLDPDVQTSVSGYYEIYVNQFNEILDKHYAFMDKRLENCFDTTNLDQKEKDLCTDEYLILIDLRGDVSEDVAKQSLELLKVFHPTRDRLKDPFFRANNGY